MDTMFENLDFRFDKENNDERPFMIACKDREIMDGERWVLVSLSTDEAKRLHTDFFMEVLIYGSFTGKRPEKDLWLRQ